MANSSFTQQALASDSHFRLRLKNALAKVAYVVLNENTAIPFHEQRANYARTTVLTNLDGTAAQLSSSIVIRTSIFAFETSYDFVAGSVVTASGDADIEGQLLTDWNILAGV